MCKGVGSEAEGTELPSTDAAHALIPCGRSCTYPACGTSLDLFVGRVWVLLWFTASGFLWDAK